MTAADTSNSETQTSLLKTDFVDLYLGQDYAEMRHSGGTQAPTAPLKGALYEQAKALRYLCSEQRKEVKFDDEFTLQVSSSLFRVTTLHPYGEEPIYVLRRCNIRTIDLETLGFSGPVIGSLLDRTSSGLVVVCGEMSSGKTSTAASIVQARLKALGGLAVAIEDPIETRLGGVHGKGRCVQIRASLKKGGYKEHLITAMRTGAEQILIGETRDEETAYEVAKASLNGHFIITTVHAGNIEQAIERLVTMCRGHHPEIAGVLADGLKCVIHQRLAIYNGRPQLRSNTLLLSDAKLGSGIKERIRQERFNQLQDLIKQQANTYMHGDS